MCRFFGPQWTATATSTSRAESACATLSLLREAKHRGCRLARKIRASQSHLQCARHRWTTKSNATTTTPKAAAGRDAEVNSMLTFHESLPQDARSPSHCFWCHQVNARQIPSSPCGSDKRGPDGKVKCRLAVHVFKKWVPTDLRFAATPLRVTLRVL